VRLPNKPKPDSYPDWRE